MIRQTRAARGRERTRRQLIDIGRELRSNRLGAGATIREASAAAEIDKMTWWRLEHGRLPSATFDQVNRAASAVGLDLGARLFLTGTPVWGAGHIALVERAHAQLPTTAPWATEVPVTGNDLRCWDARTILERVKVAFEAEMLLFDVQAIDRRAALKLRDGDAERLILVVNDSRHNRLVLREHREILRPRFPLDPRAVLGHLRKGLCPPANGLVVL